MSPSFFAAKEKVAGAGPDLPWPGPVEGDESGGKVDMAAAEYTPPEQRCKTCKYFDGVDVCSRVQGDVAPEGHSRFWESSGEEEETEETDEAVEPVGAEAE